MRNLILSFLLLITSVAFPQNGINHTVEYETGVTLDSTDSEVLYFEFYPASSSYFSTTAINPYDGHRLVDQIAIQGEIDSLKASNAADSTVYTVQFIDYDGFLTGETFYLDFSNNDTSATAVYNTFTPYNRATRTRGTDSKTFWCDLTGLLKPHYHGIKLTITHTGSGSSADSTIHRPAITQGLLNYRD